MLTCPLDLSKHVRRCGYIRLELPARKFNTVGRFVGGTMVFVKKSLAVSSVQKQYFDWGELVQFVINSSYQFSCVYRNPSSNFIDCLHLFSDLYNTSMQCFFFGDFNTELLEPSVKLKLKARSYPVDIQQCKRRPNNCSDSSFK